MNPDHRIEERLEEVKKRLEIAQLQMQAEAEIRHRDRRERIATAVLAGFMSSNAEFPRDRPPNFVGVAVALADALIAELDKEVKP